MGAENKLSKPFKIYLGKDAVSSFSNGRTKESKYCGDMVNEHFNKELIMAKKNDEDFENPTK